MAILNRVCSALCQLLSVVYVAFMLKQFFRPDQPLIILPFHVFVTVAIVFAWKPFSGKWQTGPVAISGRIFDILAICCCLYIVRHFFNDIARIPNHLIGIDEVTSGDMFAVCVGIPLLLESVRRTAGAGLVVLLLVFIAYGFWGGMLPGWFRFSDFSLETFAELAILGTEGIFGVTASAITSFVFYFILFGAFFSATGGGKIFIDIAMSIAGRRVGGPAKTAVIASALFGTISGSAIANVTSTGVLTIPLMKRTGYSPEQAAATEAIASSGGQLMPPIMGVAAFVMADILGVPYFTIVMAGILPALAFYFAIYVCIDLLARKQRIGTFSQATPTDPLAPRLHLLLGPIFLIAALLWGYSASMAALVGTAAAILSPYLRLGTWYDPRRIYGFVCSVGRQMADVSAAVTAVGLIIVVSIQSGLAIKFVTLLAELGRDSLLLSLLLVIVGCLILGMGLPTVAAYVIAAVMFVPALGKLGVDKLPAHFFVMYYSVLSQVTPPVALAAFAAAAIAKANPYRTGWIGLGLGLAIFILPIGFIRDPALLWQGGMMEIAVAGVGILCGTVSWAIALQGWLGGGRLRIFTRLAFGLCCFVIVYEPTFSLGWSAAFGVFVLLFIGCRSQSAKRFLQLPGRDVGAP
ncbi:MAG: TRAP transporter fused permease subunit [Planctomycetota bacterium]|jgi:TRAP transporter 4TM/12TM fusion protein|nr:TRAP transporter fused permease subunit [Planctomycetota bacterium]